MASQKDFKALPSLNKDITYSNWKKELRIWEAFTNLKDEKKGPAISLTLNGQEVQYSSLFRFYNLPV